MTDCLPKPPAAVARVAVDCPHCGVRNELFADRLFDDRLFDDHIVHCSGCAAPLGSWGALRGDGATLEARPQDGRAENSAA